ncbi:MAG: hypothetical protein MK078_15785 [Crocinitomicaceae bacterium]|nr:hypothetical protein [Crocinitomicaceae bacterium]
MKKKIFSAMAIAALAFTSCKEEVSTTSELGEATINGTIWADLDLTDTDVEGIEGMPVTITVNTRDWDPTPDFSYSYEQKVYSATVDANGAYSITVPATTQGYTVTLVYGDVYTTRTLADGETQSVRVSKGNASYFIYEGAVLAIDDQASVSITGEGEGDTFGSATIYGEVYAILDNGFTPEGWENLSSGNVVWQYQDGWAPYSASDETVHTVAINADGSFVITMPTTQLGDGSTYFDLGMFDFAGTQTQLNAAGDGDTTVNGIWSAASAGIEYFNFNFIEDGDIYTGYSIWLNFNEF